MTELDTRDPDARAVRILAETYWGPNGWKSPGGAPLLPSDEDYAFAIRAGVMFEPVEVDHDEVVARAIDLGSRVEIERAAGAFLASLASRRLDLRSALGSLGVARALPAHTFVRRLHEQACDVCGGYNREPALTDVNVLNF